MRKTVLLLAACVLLAGQSAHAGPAKWGPGTLTQIAKGESQEDIVALLGNPPSRKIGLGGTETWVYSRAASDHKLANAWIRFVSVGMSRSDLSDILSVTFSDGKVVDASYEADVETGGLR